MTRRGVVGSLRLGQRQILGQLPAARGSLHRRAVERIGRLGLGDEADAVVRAMTAGDRSRIPAELREAYARSGLAHLLALSGLHTGILFVAVNAALWWLPLVRYGHRWRNLLAVAAVWTFVAAAGFPASAVRAAAMCTLLQTALATSSEYDGLNALGTAAFGMLLWNPAWLHDVGFRLSVAAVAGILAWGVPLARRLRTGRRWIDAPVASLVVSAAATLATAPLVAHAFGRIPLAGIVVTPAALLPAGAVVACGALWLLLPLPPLAWLLRPAAALSVAVLDTLCRTAAAWPGAAVERSLTDRGVALTYLLFALATAAAWCVEPKKAYICPRDDTRRICPAAHRRGAPRRGAASRARPAGGGARPPRAPRPHRRHAAQVPRPRRPQAPDVRGGGVHPPAARLRAGVERGVRAPQAPRGRLGARPHVRPGGRRMGPRAPLRPRGGTRARRGAGGRRPRELPAPGGRQRGGRRRVGRGVPGLLPRAVRLGLRRPRPPLGRGTQARAAGGVLARHPGAAAPHPGRGAAPLRRTRRCSTSTRRCGSSPRAASRRSRSATNARRCSCATTARGRSTATALGLGSFSAAPDAPQPPDRSPFSPERYRYLVVPDVALQKARLVRRHLRPAGVDAPSENGYGFAAEAPHGILGRTLPIARIEPYDPKRLKREMKGLGAEILKRDFPLDATEIARRLGLHAGDDLRLAFTRIDGRMWMVVLER